MNHRMCKTVLAAVVLGLTAGAIQAGAQDAQTQSQTQSQQQQQTQQQQTQKPTLQNPIGPALSPAPAPVDPKEDAAYKSLAALNGTSATDADKEIQAGEDFVKTYPTSRYLEPVYAKLMSAYYQKHDNDKMYEDGEKALALNGDDVSVLTLLGWVLPHGKSSDPNFNDKLAQAEKYDKHALDILPTIAKPADATDDQFATSKASATAMAHSGLGIALFREGKGADAVPELQKATEGANPDPTDLFVLGLALNSVEKYADAEKAFDSCAKITGSLQETCKQDAAAAKEKAANQLQPPKP